MNLETSLAPIPGVIESLCAVADTTETTRLLYDRKSAAHQLSVSVATLDRLVANKCLTARRIGGRVLIPHGELRRFVRADYPTMNCVQIKPSSFAN
jgi:excisionase family DNA binding protein